MRKKKLRVLVTGGTGFVGSYLLPLIKRTYRVGVFDRKQGKDLKNYKDIEKDLEGIDVVIHLAYSKNYSENIEMIKNLIKAGKKEKLKKIILMSSMSAKRSFPDEYGKNKLEIELLVKNSGLNYTILRPSIIYGKGSKSFDFMFPYLQKIPFFVPIVGSGKYKISPANVEDVVEVIEKCIENRKTDKKEYDLPGGSFIYFVDLINALKRELGIRKRNIHVPIFFCNIMALFFPSIISKENIKNLTESSLADVREVRKDLNYNPIKFEEGAKNGLL